MSGTRQVRRWQAVAAGALAAGTAAAVLPGTLAGAATHHGFSGAPVTEAVITAFTGPEAFIGGVLDTGTYPAVWAINKAGGVDGHQVVVKTVDTRGDPADALPLVERFLGTTSNILGICGPDGATANQLIPLYNRHKITVTSDVGSSAFDHTSMKWFWRLIPPDPTNGLAMVVWAHDRGYKNVALVFGSDTTAQTVVPGVLAGIKHFHMNVVSTLNITPDQPSYQTDAAALLSAKPQVIFTEEDATTAGTFFGDVAQLGTVPNIIGDGATIETQWMSAVATAIGKPNFAKIYSGVTAESPKPTAANREWVTALNHASGIVKPAKQWYSEPYAMADYDGVIIQALAATAANNVSPAVYNSYIPAVTEPGPGKVKVYTYAQGVKELKAGKKIEYVGASGVIKFNQYHNSYGNQVASGFPTADPTNTVTLKVITASAMEAAG